MTRYIVSLYQGRLSRLQFILTWIYFSIGFFSIIFLVGAPVIALGTITSEMDKDSALYGFLIGGVGVLLLVLAQIAGVIIETSTIIRRLHDLNQPWWLIIVSIIPIINLLFAIYLLVAPGTPGANDYGRRVAGVAWRTLLKLPKKKR